MMIKKTRLRTLVGIDPKRRKRRKKVRHKFSGFISVHGAISEGKGFIFNVFIPLKI
jgi:hypothetical protein